jgi:hypothetical protein
MRNSPYAFRNTLAALATAAALAACATSPHEPSDNGSNPGGKADGTGHGTIVSPGTLELGATYAFQTLVATSSCLDVYGDGSADYTQIEEYGCNFGQPQLFMLLDAGNGLVSLYHAHSGKCVDVYGGGPADGTKIELYDCISDHPPQQFAIASDGAGNVTFTHPSSGKCLDVTGGYSADLTKVELYDCNGGNSQKWHPLAGGLKLGAGYTFHTAPSAGASCMDVTGDASADYTRIQEHACNGTAAQVFTVEDAGGGLVSLYHPHSGKCVDVNGNYSADGTAVQLYDCNATAAQRFAVQVDSAGHMTFVHASSGKCIDITGASASDGTKVELWDCNNGPPQQWQPIAE